MQKESLATKEAETVTPLADALVQLKQKTKCSFHALPISRGASLGDKILNRTYREIYGSALLDAETTVTSRHFDSFFFPECVIKESEQLAAELFGADGTLFVTAGTTCSNQIALHALYKKGSRVLLDKSCHQSMHFTLNTLGARIDYIDQAKTCEFSERSYWDLEELLKMALAAQQEGVPYHLIVLNAQSYDGVVYHVPNIIAHLLRNGVVTRNFLVDEAWGSANYFEPSLAQHAAMNLTPLMQEFPDLNLVATQSAHKSLSCLRQASMIHFRGDASLMERLQMARFRIHTTSPSYPILASLDLARAQMQNEGRALAQKSVALAKTLTEEIRTNPALSRYRVNSFVFPKKPFAYACPDPSKVSVNVSGLGISSADVKDILYTRHGIYVNRVTESSVLLNFHIGVTKEALNMLLNALRSLQASVATAQRTVVSDSYIIPYPPGVPLVVPGERVTPSTHDKLRRIKRSGVRVFTISA